MMTVAAFRRLASYPPLLQALVASPLLRNGYALVASAGLTSLLGLVFWGLAARLYTPEQVGIGAAMISTMLTLGNISQLNLGNLLNRYLPSAGMGARRLVQASYGLAGVAAGLLSALAVAIVPNFVPELAFLHDQPLAGAGFVIATVVWTLFALQDSVLAGLRRATVAPIENALFSLAKLLLLVVFAGVALPGSGLYAAWVLPLPLLLLLVNWLIFFRFLPRHRITGAERPDRRSLARYFGWDYAGTLASMTAMGVAPLIVLHHGGSKELAVYYISWEIAYGIYLISRSMGISLLAEIAFDRTKFHLLAINALFYTLMPLAAAVAVIFIGAPLLLHLLGTQYAGESSLMLRLLVLSCLPWSVVTLMLALARANGRTQAVAAAQIVTLAVVLGAGAPLAATYGAAGMAAAWLAAHCLTLAGLLIDLFRRLGPSGRVELVLRLLSALAGLRGHLLPAARSGASLLPVISQFCAEKGIAAPDPDSIREFHRESDVRTAVFQTSAAERFIFKQATSLEGAAALCRHIVQSEALAQNAGIGLSTSRIVASHSSSSCSSLVERAYPGEDGRVTLATPVRHFPALALAFQAIGKIHRSTARIQRLDDGWMNRWVDDDIARVPPSRSPLVDRARALSFFRDAQHRFWVGRHLPLGLGHGDFAPGNLLFLTGPGESEVKLSAIIDWEAACPDAPPGLDEIFLLLTARAQRSGEELGFAVQGLLTEPLLSSEEQKAVESSRGTLDDAYGTFTDPKVIHALCGLAWWRHVAANLRKSPRFAENPLWMAINIDLVLSTFIRSQGVER